MKELRGSSVLVLGLGISGKSAAQFCAAHGAARVVAADERPREALGDLGALEGAVEICAGGALPDPSEFDLVVPSPGVAPARYAARARRVWGDLELAYRALAVPIVGITGTNGKSTTTRLVEAMARAAGLRAQAQRPGSGPPGRTPRGRAARLRSRFRPRLGARSSRPVPPGGARRRLRPALHRAPHRTGPRSCPR
ncbi:MAG TPA: hypothetical protein VKM54_05085, partial [Myxococcota bacterium]|nr:hypothetical protein [Myxococcota bacterium]